MAASRGREQGGPAFHLKVIGRARQAPVVSAAMRWLVVLVLNLMLAAGVAPAAERSGVVVELYTSQGCSSCPAADAYLSELAQRADVVALAFHVDYWDHLGWRDPYARHGNSKRQRNYVAALGARYVYTPQMVVDGSYQDVGSNRQRIEYLIAKAARQRAAGPMIGLAGRELSIGDMPVALDGGEVGIWVFYFARARQNDVASGENRGRTMRSTNVVRAVQSLGPYDGKARSMALDLANVPADCDGVAVLVQQAGPGRVIAARAFDLPTR